MRASAFKTLAACVAICAASPCFSQSRPNTTAMSCIAAKRLVDARGAIVLSTGATTYDRYVDGPAFCAIDEFVQPAFVPSATNQQCFIGYYCVSRSSKDIR